MSKKPNPTWADVSLLCRKSSARILIQAIWAMANATDLDSEAICNVIGYMHEQQDSFIKGYMNYKDVVDALYEERGIDIREVEKTLHEGRKRK